MVRVDTMAIDTIGGTQDEEIWPASFYALTRKHGSRAHPLRGRVDLGGRTRTVNRRLGADRAAYH
jgi:hypothetical protein